MTPKTSERPSAITTYNPPKSTPIAIDPNTEEAIPNNNTDIYVGQLTDFDVLVEDTGSGVSEVNITYYLIYINNTGNETVPVYTTQYLYNTTITMTRLFAEPKVSPDP